MKSILCCHSKIRGHKPVGQVVSFSVTNEIPCSFLPDDSVWLLECSHVKRKVWTRAILWVQGLSSFHSSRGWHFCAQKLISTLSDYSGLCRGTVDGQIICHNFSHASISPSCRPTSDLGSQWKGEDLAQEPWKIAKVPYPLLPCSPPPPTLSSS